MQAGLRIIESLTVSVCDSNFFPHYRALNYLFDTLKKYGLRYSEEFWDVICRQVLFPIFGVLKSKSDVSKFANQEDMSVWLSTTMIQALRNLVDLFTYYFETLGNMIEGILDLLGSCLCQGKKAVSLFDIYYF